MFLYNILLLSIEIRLNYSSDSYFELGLLAYGIGLCIKTNGGDIKMAAELSILLSTLNVLFHTLTYLYC